MYKIDYTLSHTLSEDYGYSFRDLLFFDIETTGFLSSKAFVYLIGVCYYADSQWQIRQWFAKGEEEEKEILFAFLEFARNYTYLVSYNGEGFDVPFLKERSDFHRLNFNLSYQSMDIYRILQPFKHILKVENLKQKTMEKFLHLERKDMYSGKELIAIYDNYIHTQKKEEQDYLLLHNKEDVEGLLQLFPLLSYSYVLNGNFQLENAYIENYENIKREKATECIFRLLLPHSLPVRISYGKGDFYFTGVQNHLNLRVKVFSGELKYFYQNYKDYYYLPVEDVSLHKSVAYYVDKNFRVQAKASNCYSKKNGHFLPQLQERISPYFKREYKDTITYFECTDELLQNQSLLSLYIKDIFQYLIKNKVDKSTSTPYIPHS